MVFVLLGLAVHLVVSAERLRQEQRFRSHVAETALAIVSRLEVELSADVFLANGLVAMIQAVPKPTDQQMHTALKAVHSAGSHLRNVAVAPDNRIRYIYPLEGNRNALGLHYPDVPSQWPAVQKAMRAGTTVLAGPVLLRQGGSGLVSRTPVYLDQQRYWGMLSLVIDTDRLFRKAGLATELQGIRLAIRGRDGQGATGEVFFGDPALFSADSLRLAIAIPGGSWQMAAIPSQGWSQGQRWLDITEAAALLVCALIALAAKSYQQSRTHVEASERRLRAFLSTTRDAVIVTDDQGLIEESNPAAQRLFTLSGNTLLGMPIGDLVEGLEVTPTLLTRPLSSPDDATEDPNQPTTGLQTRGHRGDGSEFPVEVSMGDTVVEGRRIHVAVMRDITERQAFERKLVELATTDALTGVANRRAVLEELEAAFALCRRHERPLAILMIDADHFKRINDSHGHAAGDRVLVNLTAVACACLRNTDLLGRMGGEEFIALLPDTPTDQALAVAQRLLATLSTTAVDIGLSEPLYFTVSIGLAFLEPETPNTQSLIQAADEALYRAKAQGRNRCCCAPATHLAPPRQDQAVALAAA